MNGMLMESNETAVKKSTRRRKPKTNSTPSNDAPADNFNPEPPVTSSAYPSSIAPTTLERSLASISHVNGGPDIPSFTIPASSSLKQKKKPKKKKKSANHAAAEGDTDEDENPWMPVSSKKTKLTKSQNNKEAVEPTAPPIGSGTTDMSEKKKRKRRSEKKTLPAPPVTSSSSSEEAPQPQLQLQQQQQHAPSPVGSSSAASPPPLPPAVSAAGDSEPVRPKQQQQQQPQQPRQKSTSLRSTETSAAQPSNTKPAAATSVKAASSQKTLLTYAQELEFLVAEALGLEALVNTRTRFTELALPDLFAHSTAPTSLSAASLPADVIQLRAHLRAKEAECQVLRDEVVRMHSDIISLKTAALTAPLAAAPPPPQPVQEKKPQQQPAKVTCVSKSVQSDPVPQEAPAAAPAPAAATSSRPSDIVIMTLQEEIGRLAKESTLMSQRNANLEKRLATMQSEMKRATAKATKAAEASAAERIEKSEARVKQLQGELNQKTQLLASQNSQLEQAEEGNRKSSQELQRILVEYEGLRKADLDLKEQLSGASSQIEDLQHQLIAKEMERESAVRKERLAAQTLAEVREQMAHLESSIKNEATSSDALQQRIAQLMLDAEKDHRLTQQLEEDLASSKRELSARQESLAKAKEEASSAQQELLSIRQELTSAHSERDSLKANLTSAQQELAAAQSERDSLKANLSSAQQELTAAHSERDTLKANLTSAQQELTAAHNERDTLKANLTSAQQELTAAHAERDSLKADLSAAQQEARVAVAAASAVNVEEIAVPQAVASTFSSAKHHEASSTVFSATESCASCSALASEVEHYKQVLDDTENALSKLQTSVAQEEDRWWTSLQEVTSENANLKKTVKKLTEEAADLSKNHRGSDTSEAAEEVLENGLRAKEKCQEHMENGHCVTATSADTTLSQEINGGDVQ